MEGISPEQLREALASAAWQLNEAVSLLREVRLRVALPEELGEEIDDGLPAMQAALKSLVALNANAETFHADYDVALPEIEEWVNRNGA